MKRFAGVGLALAMSAALATSAAAQNVWVFGGGGVGVPLGDFDDVAKIGWIVTGGLGVDIGTQGVYVAAEGFYGVNDYDSDTGPVAPGKAKIFSGFGSVGYAFLPDKKASPYVEGGAGFMNFKDAPTTGSSSSETKFAFTGALGVSIKATNMVNVWFEGRYIGSSKFEGGSRINQLPISAGISISFKSSGGM